MNSESRATLRLEIERRARAEERAEYLDAQVLAARASIAARRRRLPRPVLAAVDLVGDPALGSLAGEFLLRVRALRAPSVSEPALDRSPEAAAERARRVAVERRTHQRHRELAGWRWHDRALALAAAAIDCSRRRPSARSA